MTVHTEERNGIYFTHLVDHENGDWVYHVRSPHARWIMEEGLRGCTLELDENGNEGVSSIHAFEDLHQLIPTIAEVRAEWLKNDSDWPPPLERGISTLAITLPAWGLTELRQAILSNRGLSDDERAADNARWEGVGIPVIEMEEVPLDDLEKESLGRLTTNLRASDHNLFFETSVALLVCALKDQAIRDRWLAWTKELKRHGFNVVGVSFKPWEMVKNHLGCCVLFEPDISYSVLRWRFRC